jgi:hypothetical protein
MPLGAGRAPHPQSPLSIVLALSVSLSIIAVLLCDPSQSSRRCCVFASESDDPDEAAEDDADVLASFLCAHDLEEVLDTGLALPSGMAADERRRFERRFGEQATPRSTSPEVSAASCLCVCVLSVCGCVCVWVCVVFVV